jgi:1-deoxy-D-xylulose 5-phosphate reductoisomerase
VLFPQIWHVVKEVMNRHTAIAHPDLDAILEADQWARNEAQGRVKSLNR